MPEFRITAAAQGLYEVRPADPDASGARPLLARIANNGRGRWLLYRVENGQRIGDTVDVTNRLHSPEALDRAIVWLLAAERP